MRLPPQRNHRARARRLGVALLVAFALASLASCARAPSHPVTGRDTADPRGTAQTVDSPATSAPTPSQSTTSPVDLKHRLARCLKTTAHYAKHPHDDWRPTAATFVASCHEVPPPVLLGDLAPETVYGLTNNEVFFSLRFQGLSRLADASCDCQAFLSAMGHVSCGLFAYGSPYSDVLRYNGGDDSETDSGASVAAAVTAYCPEWRSAVPASELVRAKEIFSVALVEGVDVADPTTMLTVLVREVHPDVHVSEEVMGYVADQTCLALGDRAAGDVRNFAVSQGFDPADALAVELDTVSIACPEFVSTLKHQMRAIAAEYA